MSSWKLKYISYYLPSIHRYASRAVMIEFSLPQLDPSVTDYACLPVLMDDSVKSIGFLIGLGKKFVDEGISSIDEVLAPRLKAMLPKGIWPRVIPGYAILLWFAYQVESIILFLAAML